MGVLMNKIDFHLENQGQPKGLAGLPCSGVPDTTVLSTYYDPSSRIDNIAAYQEKKLTALHYPEPFVIHYCTEFSTFRGH